MRIAIALPSGRTAGRPRTAVRLWRVLGLFCALALFAVVLIGTDLLLARASLSRGANEAQSALRLATTPAAISQLHSRAMIRSELQRASTDFGTAHADLEPIAPLLSRLGGLPLAGPTLAAAAPAASAAYAGSESALDLLRGLEPTFRVATGARRQSGGVARLALAVRAGSTEFEASEREANATEIAISAVPPNTGDRTLDAATTKLRREAPVLLAASRWLSLAPALLGVVREAHYLFAWENPAELRATGGFIGASDYLTVDRGTIHSAFNGHVLPHEITSVPPPLPEIMYTPEQYWLFSDSNWSPDFPLSARLERWFYGEDTGHWADGVIDFVDTGTTDILRGTGPVFLPGYKVWVTARNASALAQKYINGDYKGPIRHGPADTVRKQFFAAVLQAMLRRVETLPLSQWPALGAALYQAIRHREIMVYDRRPAIQRAIRALGADGGLRRQSGDYLAIVDDNRSYNKINPYVHESVTYSAAVQPDLTIHSELVIHYTLAPSPANLEGGGPNWGLWGTKHDYQDFLRVYVPPGARLIAESGADRWAPQPAYGLTEFAGRFIVREGRSLTVRFRYILPPAVLAADSSEYSLTVRRQPGSNLTSLQTTIKGARGVQLAVGRERPRASETIRIPLQQDGILRLRLLGETPAGAPTIVLRSNPTGDPYVPYRYLRDARHPL